MSSNDMENIMIDEEEHEDVEENSLTPSEVLAEMTQALINESAAPKILPHKIHLVECLVDQIEHMESNISKQTDKSNIKCTAHRMELYRINYIINTYLRARLKKIEENTNDILKDHYLRNDNPEKEELLDEKEVDFAESYKTVLAEHFQKSFLNMVPEAISQIPVASTLLGNSRIFIEVLKDNIEEVNVLDMADPNAEVIIRLEKGSRHLIPFQSIEEHLEQGNVNLL